MRNYDLTPLYRSSVGFDRVFDLLENVSNKVESGGYPPYNIEKVSEDDYRITIAVAGFGEGDIDIETHENELKIIATRPDSDEQREFLHQGIAGRAFERRFQLAEHVLVSGASLVNGLLNIELKRELPEAKKPRKIAIGDQSGSLDSKVQVLKGQSAA
jgi:Molecular chaperone (small heat shock protein)